MVTRLSQRGYARHRGVTHGAVQKAIASARITALPDGRIDPEAADRQWDANTLPRAVQQSGDDQPGMTLSEARALRMHYQAELLRLKYEQRAAELVPADEARAAALTCARYAREVIMRLPGRAVPRLAGLTDVAECQRVLEEEVWRVLDELSAPWPRTDARDSQVPRQKMVTSRRR